MKKEGFKIRKARKNDIKNCQKLIYNSLKTAKLNKNLQERLFKEYTLDKLKELLKQDLIYISENKNSIIGTGRLSEKGEIRSIYVHPKFQRKGFGKAMIKKIENLAKKRRYKRVFLHSLPNALEFYEKLGFKKKRTLKDRRHYLEKIFT